MFIGLAAEANAHRVALIYLVCLPIDQIDEPIWLAPTRDSERLLSVGSPEYDCTGSLFTLTMTGGGGGDGDGDG